MVPRVADPSSTDCRAALPAREAMLSILPRGLGDGRIELGSDDVSDAVDHLIADLVDAGIPPGGRVGVYLRGGVEFVVALYALHELAVTLVPIDVLDWAAVSTIPNAGLDALLTHRSERDTIDDVLDVVMETMTGIHAIGAGYELIMIRADPRTPIGHMYRFELTDRTVAALIRRITAVLRLGPHDRIAMWDGFCTPVGVATVLAARRCGAEMRVGDRCESPTILMVEQHRLLDCSTTATVSATTSVVVPGGRLSGAAAARWDLVEVGSVTTSAIYRNSRAA